MPQDQDAWDIGEGSIILNRDRWLAVMAALEGYDGHRDAAFDALQLWAPQTWLNEVKTWL